MQSKATTVAAYLAELPAERREAIETVRTVILKNLDRQFEEGMQYGMIGYYVPHSVYPPGYHCDPKQPLPFVCLASQKHHLSVYLSCLFGEPCDDGKPSEQARWFAEAWAATGKRLDMGRSCIRFKRAEDLALDVLGEAIRRMPARLHIKLYEQAIASGGIRARSWKQKKTTAKATTAPAPLMRPPAAGASARGTRRPRARVD